MEAQAVLAAENPFGYGYLLNSIYLYLQKPKEITIINTMNSEIVNSLNKQFLPESILVMVNSKEQLSGLSKFPFFAGKDYDEKKTIGFVCKDFTCSLPLESIEEIEKQL